MLEPAEVRSRLVHERVEMHASRLDLRRHCACVPRARVTGVHWAYSSFM
jgi:hypothetical protein